MGRRRKLYETCFKIGDLVIAVPSYDGILGSTRVPPQPLILFEGIGIIVDMIFPNIYEIMISNTGELVQCSDPAKIAKIQIKK